LLKETVNDCFTPLPLKVLNNSKEKSSLMKFLFLQLFFNKTKKINTRSFVFI